MEQIVIQVRDKNKAKLLQDFLRSIDFVDVVKTREVPLLQVSKTKKKSQNFFALAGLWKDRDIDLAAIRAKAWPRQQP